MLGQKKYRATSLLGVKQHVPQRVLGHKTYGQMHNINVAKPNGNNSNGIVNESHGAMMDREPMKNSYNPPKTNNKSNMERQHKSK